MSTLRQLFVVDVKRRLINNTPSDVYRLAARVGEGRAEVVDLRFSELEDGLPDADAACLFLETAGTWMCFDWDPARFASRLEHLLERYARVTVVGPQARALRDLTGRRFDVVETLDFEQALLPEPAAPHPRSPGAWLEPARHRHYNGQCFDGTRLSLVPTVSVAYVMRCPLRCSFCYYADSPRYARPPFAALLGELERIWRHGHRNVYFMDPNFLPSSAELDQLRAFHERTDGGFTYYCQLSPNFLGDARLERLAASGCRGMVIGIENRERIAAKGSVEQARERVARVLELGMMPTLFFMIDAENDVEEVVEHFRGVPFRYTVLNDAFASDRSLPSIVRGFEQKRLLAAERRAVIDRLAARPEFLGSAAGAPR